MRRVLTCVAASAAVLTGVAGPAWACDGPSKPVVRQVVTVQPGGSVLPSVSALNGTQVLGGGLGGVLNGSLNGSLSGAVAPVAPVAVGGLVR